MDLTAELVALVERTEPDPGPDAGTTEHSAADFALMADAMLGQHDPEQLWAFAYGSLIWNPEFEAVEQRRAVATGWHRSFCLTLTRGRGTRQLPALMYAFNTISKLEEHGIRDRNLWRIQKLMAAEIQSRHRA